MEGLSGRICCALLLAVLCVVPLVASKAFKDTYHFALSVQQAKVKCPVTSCFLVFGAVQRAPKNLLCESICLLLLA